MSYFYVWCSCASNRSLLGPTISSTLGLKKTLRPRHNGHHFADDTFKHIFLNVYVRILIQISLEFVPRGPINSLVQNQIW